MSRRVVIVGFDGLRPDFITRDVMPHLYGFIREGAFFGNHRCAFPSETRVNMTTIATGCYPEVHGIVGNRFFDRAFPDAGVIDTSNSEHIDRLEESASGGYVEATTLAEALAAAGKTLGVIATGSRGSSRLLAHRGADLGGVCLSCAHPAVSYPSDLMNFFVEKFDISPAADKIDLVGRATDVFLDDRYQERNIDVSFLWFVEPDHSFHYRGLMRSGEILTKVDSEFGRVLRWWRSRNDIVLGVMSDHGHLLLTERAPVLEEVAIDPVLAKAVFGSGSTFLPGHINRIWLGEPDPGLVGDVVRSLSEKRWIGNIVAGDRFGPIEGAFPMSLVRADHRRSPDIAFTLRSDPFSAAERVEGQAVCLSRLELPEGAGYHGGLGLHEMRSFLCLQGPGVVSRLTSMLPSGAVDVLPTVLHVAGVRSPRSAQGRVLHEAFSDAEIGRTSCQVDRYCVSLGGYVQYLYTQSYAGVTYVSQGLASGQ